MSQVEKSHLKFGNSFFTIVKTKESTFYEFRNPELCGKIIRGEEIAPPEKKDVIFNTVRETQKIKSFCYTCTHELKTELAASIYSLRQFHKEPIFVLVDQETKDYLKKYDFSKLKIKVGANKEHLQEELDILGDTYDDLNTFHRKDCIAKKMDVMDWALESNDNTFFLDSDIIVLSNLQENFTSDICLSPHFHSDDDQGRNLNERVGIYNAGYIFCSNKDFPKWWKTNFYNHSLFYEQECMNRIPDHFSTQCFPQEHNLGFWRKGFGYINDDLMINFKVKSFHLHLTTTFDEKQHGSLKEKTLNLRIFFEKYLRKNGMVDFYNELMSISKDSPLESVKTKGTKKKLAFIHYGKAGGVYCVHYLNHFLMKGANRIDSWPKNGANLKRDWTREELLDFCEKDYNSDVWVHNHHINWYKDVIQKYRENEWFTFSFIRKPEEILCSLWNYIRDKKGLNLFGELEQEVKKPLDQFIAYMLSTEKLHRNLWILPDYIDDLDYVAEMNDKNFGDFCQKYFAHEHIPQTRKNTSSNKGYKFYRENGDISDATHEKLINHPEYLRYQKYLDE